MKKILSNNEIVDALLKQLNLENDNQLANHFNVERQQIRQFRNGQRIGLTHQFFTELISTHKKGQSY